MRAFHVFTPHPDLPLLARAGALEVKVLAKPVWSRFPAFRAYRDGPDSVYALQWGFLSVSWVRRRKD